MLTASNTPNPETAMNAAAIEVRHAAERVLLVVLEEGVGIDVHEMTPDAAERIAGFLARAARRARTPHASLTSLLESLS